MVGILNSYDHFTIPALTPVFWNLAIIVGLVVGVPPADSAGQSSTSTRARSSRGRVIQLLLPLPWLRGPDGRLRVAIDIRDPAVKRVFVLMLPVTLGLGLINFNMVVGTFFAARYIDPTSPRARSTRRFASTCSRRASSRSPSRPSSSRPCRGCADAGDLDGFRDTVSSGIRQIAFLLVPAGAVSAALAEPIVRLLYQRGDFAADQTTVVAAALAAFSLGLPFNGTMLMLNRAFFSLQSPWIPTAIALGNLALNIGALRGALPGRDVGNPARDVAGEHRRRRGARGDVAPPASGRVDAGG